MRLLETWLACLVALSLLIALSSIAAAGCVRGANLALQAHIDRFSLTPNGDGIDDTVVLSYSLSGAARVSISVLDEGQQTSSPLRAAEPRPPGDYRLVYDGTHEPRAGSPDRRVLPDGTYHLRVEATGPDGRQQSSSEWITVRGGDANGPTLAPIVVAPSAVSADDSELDGPVAASFRLSKESLVSIFVEDQQGRKVDVRVLDQHRVPGEYTETWTPTVNTRPLPAGLYRYMIVARDAAGNMTTSATPVRVYGGGTPQAKILWAEFLPSRVPLGGSVRVRLRIRNTGSTALRTQGPEPGYRYASYESFGSIANGEFTGRAGAWRVGVDWADASVSAWPANVEGVVGPLTAGPRYPYRWGLGRDLPPGEEADIFGEVQLLHPIPRLWLFAGIIREGVHLHEDRVGRALIEVGP